MTRWICLSLVLLGCTRPLPPSIHVGECVPTSPDGQVCWQGADGWVWQGVD